MSDLSNWLVGISGGVIVGLIVQRFQQTKQTDDSFEKPSNVPENPNSLDGQAMVLNETVAGRIPQLTVEQIRARNNNQQNSSVGKMI